MTGTEAERAPAEAREEFLVVRNDEEQYSIWRADRDLPAGWYADGCRGARQECLDHIEEVWTDMRPLSLRRRLAGADV
ncbi:MbtH family protein [Streptomyces sp. NPDC088729]|uniref:MbtH family protein n=1 Tax=unclassified Streptomyces TaxID=2593676 RepID=UPI000F558BBE|nr:MbtH family NRPS accessory protein [Streptomyces sp. ADI96-02]